MARRSSLSNILDGASRDLDLAPVLPYRVRMSEEISKRIDDLHKRFDDLRADMNQRFADVNKRIDELRADLGQRLTDLHGTLRVFMWVVSGWFMFLTAVLAVFGFLRR